MYSVIALGSTLDFENMSDDGTTSFEENESDVMIEMMMEIFLKSTKR